MKTDKPEKQILDLISEIRFDSYTRGHNDCLEMERHFKTNESYEKGLNDAWECMRRMYKMKRSDVHAIFGTEYLSQIVDKFPASEAIEKIKEYKKEKIDTIKIGDEVYCNAYGNGVVTRVYDRTLTVTWADGTHGIINSDTVTKAGKTFPEMAEILEAMK